MKSLLGITLGSTSQHKFNALKEACRKLKFKSTILCTSTMSGENEQPVGFEETFRGAWTRADWAHRFKPGNIGIGIESGIFCFHGVTLDIAVIVLIARDGRKIITTSEGVQFPQEFVRIAQERGFKNTTVGSIITERLGGDPTDPHSILTGGRVTRTMTLVDALVTALKQL